MQSPLQFYRAKYENAVIIRSKLSTWTFKYTESFFRDKIFFEMKNSRSRQIDNVAPLYNSAQTTLKTSIYRVLYSILSQTNTICFVYINFLCWLIAANTTTTAATTTITLTTTTTTQQFGKPYINAS